MRDPTCEFFEDLGRRGHERMLADTDGTILFSLTPRGHRTNHWLLRISCGDVRVSREREERQADCTFRGDQELWDRVVTGHANAQQAWLRYDIVVIGDLMLARHFTRILPGPVGARHPRAFVAERRKRP
jgi:SCP-2 sterol transfer family